MNGVSNACTSGVMVRSLHKSVPLGSVLIDQLKAENVSAQVIWGRKHPSCKPPPVCCSRHAFWIWQT